jgi:acyl carrier protein
MVVVGTILGSTAGGDFKGKDMRHELHGEVEVRIREIIRNQFQRGADHSKDLDIHTPILGKGLGLDSLEALVLVTKIENVFGIEIDDDELNVTLFDNIGTLAEHVKKKLAGSNHGRGSGGE